MAATSSKLSFQQLCLHSRGRCMHWVRLSGYDSVAYGATSDCKTACMCYTSPPPAGHLSIYIPYLLLSQNPMTRAMSFFSPPLFPWMQIVHQASKTSNSRLKCNGRYINTKIILYIIIITDKKKSTVQSPRVLKCVNVLLMKMRTSIIFCRLADSLHLASLRIITAVN